VLFRSAAWSEFGYYYKGSNIVEGAELLETIRTSHSELLEVYKSHARTLAWKHSPYNPDVHRSWKTLLNV
jgi:adenine-specific DNA glycosylase